MKLRQRRHQLLLLTVFSDSAIRSTAASHSTVYRPVDFGDFYRCLYVARTTHAMEALRALRLIKVRRDHVCVLIRDIDDLLLVVIVIIVSRVRLSEPCNVTYRPLAKSFGHLSSPQLYFA